MTWHWEQMWCCSVGSGGNIWGVKKLGLELGLPNLIMGGEGGFRG